MSRPWPLLFHVLLLVACPAPGPRPTARPEARPGPPRPTADSWVAARGGPRRRAEAAAALVKLGAPAAPAVVAAALDGMPADREEAAKVVVALGPAAGAALVDALRTAAWHQRPPEDGDWNPPVLQLLVRVGRPAIPALLAALERLEEERLTMMVRLLHAAGAGAKDPRLPGAYRLGILRHAFARLGPVAAPTLVAVLRERLRRIDARQRLPPPDGADAESIAWRRKLQILSDRYTVGAVTGMLVRLGDPAIAALETLLADPGVGVRSGALEALAAGPSPAALAAVEKALVGPDRELRRVALGRLAARKDAAATDALARALTHPEREVRRAAAEALALREDGRARAALCQLLLEPEAELHPVLLQLLGKLREAPCAAALAVRLPAATAEQRRALLAVLAEASDPAVVPHLLAALKHPGLDVRVTAVLALGSQLDRRPDPAVLRTVLALAQAKDAEVRAAVVEALQDVDDARVDPALFWLARDKVGTVSQAARKAQAARRKTAWLRVGECRRMKAVMTCLQARLSPAEATAFEAKIKPIFEAIDEDRPAETPPRCRAVLDAIRAAYPTDARVTACGGPPPRAARATAPRR